MRKYLIFVMILLVACSGTSSKKKDYNGGWDYEWYYHFSKKYSAERIIQRKRHELDRYKKFLHRS
jgi:hypothetical protein